MDLKLQEHEPPVVSEEERKAQMETLRAKIQGTTPPVIVPDEEFHVLGADPNGFDFSSLGISDKFEDELTEPPLFSICYQLATYDETKDEIESIRVRLWCCLVC